ncbi:condensin-2 complex subunit G2-like isoform X2 [Acanthaster planci]|uniref:Condensin-2 complex subunit G2-like isoform X2 n=1 Tax=Acanthaster planci TaxID=133434 RepID=A0A8B7XLR3_ACAPL|nr:condensin-2 complex subunit G2-like isoform X2 [Acanthaster planci]
MLRCCYSGNAQITHYKKRMVAPSCLREAFLEAAENDDRDEFIHFLQRHNAKDDDFTIEEVLQSLSRKQYERVWSGLNQMCASTLLHSPFETAGGSEEEAGNKESSLATHACLQGIVTVATMCLTMEKPIITQPMFETAVYLHGVLLDLPDSASKLQQGIAKLCEKWWAGEHAGQEELVANTLMYYLVRSLQPTATIADVKSVDGLRQALSKINLEEESSATLKDLLEQCMTRRNYLKQDKGRRFLSFLLTMSPTFLERLHKTIKTQLPVCPRSLIDSYGEIYFKAWRVASGPMLEKLEKYCIQDLMYHAVHASRVGTRSLASTLRQLLSYFCKQKRQQGVDKMLLALYEPIIWRAVKVANASVRANAAALLIDAFPLQDPESNKEDSDALTQKQFDIFQDLLDDPCPVVRVTGVHGICRIASVFWELIPGHTLEAFITKLIRDMAFDVSTADVRASVFKGLTNLLDNHLSHPLLKNLLPILKDFIHDTSEKVRVAFVDLLLKVKGLRTIKFWSITPMEHLLGQLVEDSAPVARRLVSLLFNSLQPVDRTGEVQIERCIALIQTNPGAIRVFYQYAHRHMSVATAGKFLLLLGQCILGCIRKAQSANGQPQRKEGEGQEAGEEEDGKENEAGLRGEDGDEESLSLQDADIMEGMLEIIAVLWTGINDQLAKLENQTTKKQLVSRFSKALPEFLTVFQEGRALSAVLVIAGYVPSSSIPTFSRGCLTTLKTMSPSATSSDFGPLLECLVSWGRGSDVLELISDWLVAALRTSPKSKKKSRQVSFRDPVQPRPSLALSYLDWLLSHFPCLSVLLASCSDKLQDLTSTLKTTLPCLEQRLLTPDPLSDLATDEVMVGSLQMYCRLQIHLTSGQLNQDSSFLEGAASSLTELLAWADREILPMIRRGADLGTDCRSEDDCPTAKRMAMDKSEKNLLHLGKEILKVILSMSSETVMLGIGDRAFQSNVADFCQLLLKTGHGFEHLPDITRLLYQITQQDPHQSVMQDREVNDEAVPTRLLGGVVKALADRIMEDSDGQSEQTLTAIKPAVRGVLHCCHKQQQGVRGTPAYDIMPSVMAAIVAEVTHRMQGGGLDHCQDVTKLPTLSAFLLDMIARTQSMLGSFVNEIEQCTSSNAVQSVEDLVGMVYILHAVSHGTKKVAGIKTCLTAVNSKLEDLQKLRNEHIEDDVAGPNADNFLFQQATQMMQDIVRAIGGQA